MSYKAIIRGWRKRRRQDRMRFSSRAPGWFGIKRRRNGDIQPRRRAPWPHSVVIEPRDPLTHATPRRRNDNSRERGRRIS